MRVISLAITFSTMLAGLLARQVVAQEPAPVVDAPAPAPAPDPVSGATPQPPPRSSDDPRARERLVARDALVLRGPRVFRGDVSLQPSTFYTIVGRPDLAAQLRRRKVARIVGISVGGGVAAIGVIWGVVDLLATSWDNYQNRLDHLCGTRQVTGECADRSHASATPWIVAVGGGLLALGSIGTPSDPLSAEEKSGLVDEYNRRLRASAGLAGALEAAKRTANVRVEVLPDGRSGMLLASCAF
jgi:hypothetical protein